MRVSILVPDISSNAMARTCPIAKVIERNHKVEIIGFDPGDGFYEPWRDEFDVISFPVGKTPVSLYRNIKRASKMAAGADVCYAFRPCAGSFGVGLHRKRLDGTPLLLDIEDLIRFEELARWHQLYQVIRYSMTPNSEFYADVLRRFTNRADAVTVTSRVLENKYDGFQVPYGPDPEEYFPGRFECEETLRKQVGDHNYVIFAGTIRPHKGLDILADAVALAKNDLRILFLGFDPEEQLPELQDRSGNRIDFLGTVPHHEVPRYLDFADIVALPQKDTRYTRAQVPEKLFEGMSMAKPIVASAVSDFPEILDNCGIIINPENPDLLAEKLDWIVENPNEAAAMGQRARETYIQQYGWDVIEGRLEKILIDVTEEK